MSGSHSRRKGYRGEAELVAVLRAAGIDARRVPLSGAVEGFEGDVLADLAGDGHPERWEVKRRGSGFKRLYGWLTDCYALAFRGDRAEWLVCLRLADLLELLRPSEPERNTRNDSRSRRVSQAL